MKSQIHFSYLKSLRNPKRQHWPLWVAKSIHRAVGRHRKRKFYPLSYQLTNAYFEKYFKLKDRLEGRG